MKKALVSPSEPVESGYRVAEVSDNSFEIAPPLFWVDCADDVVADQFYFDPAQQAIFAKPVLASTIQVNDQPVTTGSQSF